MHILWIPHTGWHIPQRAHIFCRDLSKRHTVHVTDWVADFVTIRDYVSVRYARNFTYRRNSDNAITVHGIPRISPALPFALLRRLNQRIFSSYVQRIIKQEHIDVVVGTFVCPPPIASRIVFDLFDENVTYWRSISRYTKYADEIEQAEVAYLRCADAVVAASSVLAEKAESKGARSPIYVIPNGVNLKQFDEADGKSIRNQLGICGKVAGMVGNHDRIEEIDKVLDAAYIMRHDDITFLIAGRGSAIPHAARRIQRDGINNVHLKGYIPPDQIPNFLAALDLGICPYAKTPMDDARSPMRLFAYVAAGLPIVCTDLEEVRRINFPNVVLVGDGTEHLVHGIKQAVQMSRVRPVQIEQYELHRLVMQYETILCGETDRLSDAV